MIVYHASTVQIKDFYIPYGGLHVGGLHSSLEAALRKLRSVRNVHNADTVFLHTCEVQLGKTTVTDDVGGDEAWREIIAECKVLGFDSVQYFNEYEPDSTDSFMIWDETKIKVLKCESIHMDDAEEILNEFYDSYA